MMHCSPEPSLSHRLQIVESGLNRQPCFAVLQGPQVPSLTAIGVNKYEQGQFEYQDKPSEIMVRTAALGVGAWFFPFLGGMDGGRTWF